MTRKKPAARMPVFIILFATLLVTLALLACGGGDDEEDTESPTASPTATAATAEPTVAATAQPTADATPEATTEATPEATEDPAAPEETSPRQIGDIDGIVFQVSDGSEATFTVNEQLRSLPLPIDAVVRTTALSGHISLDGGESTIQIDLHQLSSDSSNRDRYIRQRMFPDTPTGTFTVQGLNELPSGFTDGDEVSATVDGDLTIGSVTTPLSFEVTARDDGEVVYLHGRTTFTWDQLQLGAPIAGPVVSLEDEVRTEVLLAVRPGGDSMTMVPPSTPTPAGTPQPPVPATPPSPSTPGSGVLIIPPLDGNVQAVLELLPSDEASCVIGAVAADQLAMAMGPDGPSGPAGEALLGCLSDRTAARIMLGSALAMTGQLSPESEACLSSQLDNQGATASVAEQLRSQASGAPPGLASMFAMIPFMQCLNADEAATAGLGDPQQIACFLEELGPEGLAALSGDLDPAQMGPVIQAAIACGMGLGP